MKLNFKKVILIAVGIALCALAVEAHDYSRRSPYSFDGMGATQDREQRRRDTYEKDAHSREYSKRSLETQRRWADENKRDRNRENDQNRQQLAYEADQMNQRNRIRELSKPW